MTIYSIPSFVTVDGIATIPVGIELLFLATDTLVVPAIIVYVKLSSVKLISIIYKKEKKLKNEDYVLVIEILFLIW